MTGSERPDARRRCPGVHAAAVLVAALALVAPSSAGAVTLQVNDPGDGAANACDASCTLRDAVVIANATAGEDLILIPPDTYDLDFAGADDTAAAGDLDLTEGVELRGTGTGPASVVIDASALGDRILHVPAAVFGDYDLVNLTLRDGSAADGGGALLNESDNGQVRIRRVTFDSNDSASGGGGAIHNTQDFSGNGKVLVDESTFTVNSSTASEGGAITNRGSGRVLVTDSVFAGNFANDSGGALANHNRASFVVLDSTFTENSALGTPFRGGGAVFSQSESQMLIGRSVISGNDSANGGGGVALNNSTVVSLVDTVVSGNDAGANGGEGGGGILATNDSTLNLLRTTVSGNETADTGGAVSLEVANGELFVSASTLSDNEATGQGGAIYAEDTPIVGLESTTIAANSSGVASGGGGVFNNLDVGTGHIDLERTLLADNTAAGAASNCNVAGVGLSFVSHGFNLDSTSGCGLDAAGDLENADAELGPLADNGGPTRTRALLAGSDALDAAGGCDDPDQRGVARPQPVGGECDIGAYEDRGADLRVAQRDSRDPVELGKPVTYRITVRNAGPEDAVDAILRDRLPKGTKLLKARSSGGTCTKGRKPRCELGTLSPGEDASITVRVRVKTSKKKTNVAVASSQVTDPNPTNSTSRERTQVG